MEELFVRYFHFLGLFILVSTLVGEHLLVSKSMSLRSFKKLVIVDGIYGFGAVLVLTAGLLLWFVVGKPQAFYSSNWIFHLKVTLFVIVAILSIFPTYYFQRNKGVVTERVAVPKYIITIIRIELAMLAILPLLAVLMARGVGSY